MIGFCEQIITDTLFSLNNVSVTKNDNVIDTTFEYNGIELVAKLTHTQVTHGGIDVGYVLIEIPQPDHIEIMGHVILRVIDSIYKYAFLIYVSDGSMNNAYNQILDCYPMPRFMSPGSRCAYHIHNGIHYKAISSWGMHPVGYDDIVTSLIDEYTIIEVDK